MVDDSPDAMAARLRTGFDLRALGESMRREVEAMLVAWLEIALPGRADVRAVDEGRTSPALVTQQ